MGEGSVGESKTSDPRVYVGELARVREVWMLRPLERVRPQDLGRGIVERETEILASDVHDRPHHHGPPKTNFRRYLGVSEHSIYYIIAGPPRGERAP